MMHPIFQVNVAHCDQVLLEAKLKAAIGGKYAGFDVGPPFQLWTRDGLGLTDAEAILVRDILLQQDALDSWEPSKLRNLTLTQINTEVASLDAEIDAAGNLAAAKVVLKKLLADDAKAWRIILWLLKREMDKLDGS